MAAMSLKAFAAAARGKPIEPEPAADDGMTAEQRHELLRQSAWMEEHCAVELAQVRAEMAKAAGTRDAA